VVVAGVVSGDIVGEILRVLVTGGWFSDSTGRIGTAGAGASSGSLTGPRESQDVNLLHRVRASCRFGCDG